MATRTGTALLLASLVAVTVVPPAGAATGEAPVGRPCTFLSTEPVRYALYTGSALVAAGPLVAAGSTISVRCAIHVDNDTHAAASVASTSSDPAEHVALLAPHLVTYPYLAPGADVRLCTSASVGATTWYWDGAGWTTDANSSCGDAFDATALLPEPVTHWVLYLIDCWNTFCTGTETLIVCPLLGQAAPGVPGTVDIEPGGDTYVQGEIFWDCPPYGEG